MIEQIKINNRFLLIPAAISFAAGIALSSWLNPPHILLWIIIFICPIGTLLVRSKKKISTIGIIVFFTAAGLLHINANHDDRPGHLVNLLDDKGQEATISGTLISSPSCSQKISRILVEADTLFKADTFSINPNSADNTIQGQGQSVRGKILLSTAMVMPDLSPGELLLIKCRLKEPTRYGNPGSFDYPSFLAGQDIFLTGWISSPLHLSKIKQTASPGLFRTIRFLPEKLRNKINNYLRDLPPASGGIYRAILTGDRSGIEPAISEQFKKSGTFHLLAISGLHMGLLAAGCALLLNWLICRFPAIILRYPAWKLAAVLTIPLIIIYALVAGFQPPATRAMIMTSVFLLSLVIDRQWHPPTNIAIAAFLILWWQPQTLFSVSFQLSFAAVIAITAILPHLTNKNRATEDKYHTSKIRKWLLAGIMVSLAATAGTAPLLVYYFHRISLIGVLATLILQPLLCLWALPLGLISVPLILLWPGIAHYVLAAGSAGIDLAIYLNNLLSQLPWSEIRLTTPGPWEICCYYIALITLFLTYRKKKMLLVAIPCLIIIFTSPIITRYHNHHRGFTTVSVIDVGQGSCTLIELGDGTTVLIDGGSRSQQFNSGEHIIAPFLWHKRIREIDHIIISHADSDHYNGLPFIIDNFKPQFLWINSLQGQYSYKELIKQAREKGVIIKTPQAEEIILNSGENQVINMGALHLSQTDTNDNNRSLVIKLNDPAADFIFSGDIEDEGEKILLGGKTDMKTDVLIVPHHGSATSSSKKFIQTTRPIYALISAGKHRPDIFPATEVIDRYKEAGCRIYNTARHGAITLTTENKKLNISTFLPQDNLKAIHR